MFLDVSRIYFFFFSIQNIKNNCYIFFLKFFQIIFLWWKIDFFLVIFIYIRFNFCYSFSMFPYLFMIYRYCSSIMKASIISSIDMISCCCFCFLSNQENLYMIHHNSDLFYSISNTTNEYNQGQNHYLLLSPN